MPRSARSISVLLEGVSQGNEFAFLKLIERLWSRQVRRVARRMGALLHRVMEPADLALATFHSVWKCANRNGDELSRKGVSDRNELYCLLSKITDRKIARAWRDCTRLKRDERRTTRDADACCQPDEMPASTQLSGSEPSPEQSCISAETVKEMLGCLRPRQQEIARLRLDGWTVVEIAGKLGDISTRTVERILEEIRSIWRDKFGVDDR